MARYTEADCRMCRREGTKLFLKGERCTSKKCAIEKRPTPPGQHGEGRKKVSEYAVQLREKQKAKRLYGLLETQFHGYYEKAKRAKGNTGENMLCLLERRLDNVIFRMGIGSSRSQCRQLVSHGHIMVNDKCVNIPSYTIKAGDKITVKESKRDNALFKELRDAKIVMPKWLSFNTATLEGAIIELPKREDVDMNIKEHLIVELYSK